MLRYATEIIMSALGALGFSFLFNVRGIKLLYVSLGGACAWAVCIAGHELGLDTPQAVFIATLAAALLSELLARVLKTPAIILLVPMLIPLIPGGDLYYTASHLILGELDLFRRRGALLLGESGGMAFGIILAICLCQIIRKFCQHNHHGVHNKKA